MLLDASDSYASTTPGQRALRAPALFPHYQAQILVLETSNNGNLTLSVGYLFQSFTILIFRCFFLMYNLNPPCCNSSPFLTDLPMEDRERILYLFATAFYTTESCYHDTRVLPSLYSKNPSSFNLFLLVCLGFGGLFLCFKKTDF